MSDASRDPFADLTETRERKPLPPFWQPNTPERLIGRLDRIDPSKDKGDRATFLDAVLYRTADHKPMRSGEFTVGVGADLIGRILPADSGRWFVLTFTGFGAPKGDNNPPRMFDVAVVPKDREGTLLAALRKDREVLAPTESRTDNLGGGDELPF